MLQRISHISLVLVGLCLSLPVTATSIHDEVMMGNTNTVKNLLKSGTDPNETQQMTGRTPLHFAALCGHQDIVEILLENGADPNVQDNNGATPLREAAIPGHTNLVKVLLIHGANSKVQDVNGRTPSNITYQTINIAHSHLYKEIFHILFNHSLKGYKTPEGIDKIKTRMWQKRQKQQLTNTTVGIHLKL